MKLDLAFFLRIFPSERTHPAASTFSSPLCPCRDLFLDLSDVKQTRMRHTYLSNHEPYLPPPSINILGQPTSSNEDREPREHAQSQIGDLLSLLNGCRSSLEPSSASRMEQHTLLYSA